MRDSRPGFEDQIAQVPAPPAQERIAATIEADQRATRREDAPSPSRGPSVGPDSSRDEDVRGQTRRARIKAVEKRALVLMAAKMCPVWLKHRGKERFYTKLASMWNESHRHISTNAIQKFFTKELRERDNLMGEDDITGAEYRYGAYYTPLDILRERFKLVEQIAAANGHTRTRKATTQQTTREAARVNLTRPYGLKARPVVMGGSLDEGEEAAMSSAVTTTQEEEGSSHDHACQGTPSQRQSAAYQFSSDSITRRGNQAPSMSRTTIIRRKTKQKPMVNSIDAICRSIEFLGEATRQGDRELALAIQLSAARRAMYVESDLRQRIEERQKETANRLEAIEARAKEREEAAAAQQDQILAMLSRLVAAQGSGGDGNAEGM